MTKGRAELCLLLIAFVWGSTFILMENAIKWLPPLTFLTLRFGIATICLLFIAILIRRSPIMRKSIWLWGFVLGGLLALGFALQILSLLYTTSGNSAFFTSTEVVLVPIFSLFLLATTITNRLIFSLGIVVFGLFLLSGSQFEYINPGDLLALLCAFAFALHIVCLKKWGASLPVFSLVAVQMLSATLFCGLIALAWEPWQKAFSPAVMSKPSVWVAIMVCSLLATVAAYVMQAYLQRFTTPTRMTLIMTSEPIFAVIIDYFWNHVTITNWEFLGCLLIMGGTIFAQYQKETEKPPLADSA